VTALTIAGSDEPPSALLSIRSSMLALGPKGSVACLPACLLNQWISFQMLLLAKLPASTHLATGSCEIVSCPAASVPVPENLYLGHGRLLAVAYRLAFPPRHRLRRAHAHGFNSNLPFHLLFLYYACSAPRFLVG
jgi:hypothetical protein